MGWRDRRYRTALDFAEDLRRVRQNKPIRAKPVGPVVRLRRWVQRNPALASAVFGAFVALAVGLTASLYLLDRTRDALEGEKKAKQEISDALGQKEEALALKEAALLRNRALALASASAAAQDQV